MLSLDSKVKKYNIKTNTPATLVGNSDGDNVSCCGFLSYGMKSLSATQEIWERLRACNVLIANNPVGDFNIPSHSLSCSIFLRYFSRMSFI